MIENWVNLTHPLLASIFSVPQQYYVPRRMRDTHIPRLQPIGLWNLPVDEKVKGKSFQSQRRGLLKVSGQTQQSLKHLNPKRYIRFPYIFIYF